MTVAELIEALKAYPPDLRVVVRGYEAGADDLTAEDIAEISVRLNVTDEWYYGKHEIADAPALGTVPALHLGAQC